MFAIDSLRFLVCNLCELLLPIHICVRQFPHNLTWQVLCQSRFAVEEAKVSSKTMKSLFASIILATVFVVGNYVMIFIK